MVTGFARDYKHNYLVIQDDRVIEDHYQVKMITENKVPGLLECQERMINGEGLLYYDISSRQTLAMLFEEKRIGIAGLRELFDQLTDLCERMQKYLLYGEGLVLNPEYVYLDPESRTYSFLYYPFEESEMNLMPLLDFLIEHADSEDMRAVEAVYQMADVVNRGHYSMDEALRWFRSEFAEEEEEEPVLPDRKPVEEPERPKEQAMEVSVIQKKKKHGLWELIREFFFGKQKESEELFIPEDEESYGEYGADAREETEGVTVFIPWMENSEHKLYGTDRKNKYHIDLTRAPFTIGKLAGVADVVLEDPGISRLHAKISRQSGKYYLTDMNSTNGCFHNGIRLNPNEQVEITPGDEIGFGKLKFIYR